MERLVHDNNRGIELFIIGAYCSPLQHSNHKLLQMWIGKLRIHRLYLKEATSKEKSVQKFHPNGCHYALISDDTFIDNWSINSMVIAAKVLSRVTQKADKTPQPWKPNQYDWWTNLIWDLITLTDTRSGREIRTWSGFLRVAVSTSWLSTSIHSNKRGMRSLVPKRRILWSWNGIHEELGSSFLAQHEQRFGFRKLLLKFSTRDKDIKQQNDNGTRQSPKRQCKRLYAQRARNDSDYIRGNVEPGNTANSRPLAH